MNAEVSAAQPSASDVTSDRFPTASCGAEEACWICLDEGTESRPLTRLCNCPNRSVHLECDARWRLQQAGRMEETKCRFCEASTPAWKQVLRTMKGSKSCDGKPTRFIPESPQPLKSGELNSHIIPQAETAQGPSSADPLTPLETEGPSKAYMRISWAGKTHHIEVLDGPDGRNKFVEDCRKLLDIPPSVNFDIVYHCKEPFAGGDLTLRGLDAYDAAFFCAAASTPSSGGRKHLTSKSPVRADRAVPPTSVAHTSSREPSRSHSAGARQNQQHAVERRVEQRGGPITGPIMRYLRNALRSLSG